MYADKNLEIFRNEIQRSKDIASRLSDEGIVAVLKGMMMRPTRIAVMESGKIPCLWILGKHDNYIPCDSMLSRVSLPSNARALVLENSGHLGFIEEKERFLKEVVNFIETLPAQS